MDTQNEHPTLYRDPDSRAARWVAHNRRDPRAPTISDRIVSQPQARWFDGPDVAGIAERVRAYVEPALEVGQIPVLVTYAIPQRDGGGHSAGGVTDLVAYRAWIERFTMGIGAARCMVVIEPDALSLQDHLADHEQAARLHTLKEAVLIIRAGAPQTRIFLDSGHSNWLPAPDQARRLLAAGVHSCAGFATNVSNFNSTNQELDYGRRLRRALGHPHLRQVIDVSRNGQPVANGQWCDPRDCRLGAAPTLSTDVPGLAGLLWIKRPGEADGCVAAAGQFVPELGYEMCQDHPAS
jgi:endoglucanase